MLKSLFIAITIVCAFGIQNEAFAQKAKSLGGIQAIGTIAPSGPTLIGANTGSESTPSLVQDGPHRSFCPAGGSSPCSGSLDACWKSSCAKCGADYGTVQNLNVAGGGGVIYTCVERAVKHLSQK